MMRNLEKQIQAISGVLANAEETTICELIPSCNYKEEGWVSCTECILNWLLEDK